jgi:phage terminase large subunit-like protein
MAKSRVPIKVGGIGDNGGPPINTWGEKGANPAQLIATDLLTRQRHTCLVGGARSGKTTAIVRAIILRALRYAGSRHVILRFRAIHADASIARDTIPKVMSMFFPGQRYKHIKSPHNLIRFPNGSEIWIGGLDDERRADKILGAEYATIFLNECSQISWYSAKLVLSRLAQVIERCPQRLYCDINPVGKSHWTNVLFGDKCDPDSPRAVLEDADDYARMFVNPKDNEKNLDKGYFDWLAKQTGNYRKRFYEGEYVDEVSGALWSYDLIEACRIKGEAEEGRSDPDRPSSEEPEYIQTVVAIDPSGASEPGDKSDIEMKPKNDEIGIVVASLGKDQKVYLRADLSCTGGPETWGKTAIAAYHYYKADHILAETNFGGDMVSYVIRSQDGNVPVKVVHAGKGKHIRAEPISTLYANDGVRHVGAFPQLEDQLCAFTSMGYGGAKSPDRADAWIWAVTDIALQDGANNWIEYYRRLSEAANGPQATPEKPEFGFEITPKAADKKHRVRVPDGIGTLFLIDGASMLVPDDRIVEVSAEDATAFGMRGWERLAA